MLRKHPLEHSTGSFQAAYRFCIILIDFGVDLEKAKGVEEIEDEGSPCLWSQAVSAVLGSDVDRSVAVLVDVVSTVAVNKADRLIIAQDHQADVTVELMVEATLRSKPFSVNHASAY